MPFTPFVRRLFLLFAPVLVLTVLLYESAGPPALPSPWQAFRRFWDSQQCDLPLTAQADRSWRCISSLSATIEFPKVIWQTGSEAGIRDWAEESKTWAQNNPGYEHHILTDSDADDFVHEHFNHHPSIVEFWDELRRPVLRADFLRYLTMLARGGVYADIDTSCLKSVDDWIPPEYQSLANAVVGIEYDDQTYKMFVRPLSFSQWTLMARPGHPIFERAVSRVMSNLDFLARQEKLSLSDLEPQFMDVLEGTGPGMYTDVIMEVLRDQGAEIDWSTFHEMTKPMLIGDVVVMPVNAFAGNQDHSHSGDPEYGEKFVEHHFGKTWYAPEQAQAANE